MATKILTQNEKNLLSEMLVKWGIKDRLPGILKDESNILAVDTKTKEYNINNNLRFTICKDGILYY